MSRHTATQRYIQANQRFAGHSYCLFLSRATMPTFSVKDLVNLLPVSMNSFDMNDLIWTLWSIKNIRTMSHTDARMDCLWNYFIRACRFLSKWAPWYCTEDKKKFKEKKTTLSPRQIVKSKNTWGTPQCEITSESSTEIPKIVTTIELADGHIFKAEDADDAVELSDTTS